MSEWLEAGRTIDELSDLVEAAPDAGEVIRKWRASDASKRKKGAGGDEGSEESKRSIATKLVEIVKARADLFMTPGEVGHASFEVYGHHETWPLKSRGFRHWLGRQFYDETKGKRAAGAQAIADALVTLEGLARYGEDRREVHLRVAEHGGRYYLDLADESWRAVEIGPEGWKVIDRPPVHFRRTRSIMPLPAPAVAVHSSCYASSSTSNRM